MEVERRRRRDRFATAAAASSESDVDDPDPISGNSDNEDEILVHEESEGEVAATERMCYVCKKEFSTQKTLSRHMKTQHQLKIVSINRLLNCPATNCRRNFNKAKNLREHLAMDHCIKMDDEKILKFKDFKEFLVWMATEERIANSRYRKQSGKRRRLDDVEVHEFICDTIGLREPESRGIQRMKTRALLKINAVCPSTITAYKYPCGYVKVRYFQTHVGHSYEYERLRLSCEERIEIDRLVSENATPNAVFDAVRNFRNGELDELRSAVEPDVRKAEIVYELMEGRRNKDRRSDHDRFVAELSVVEQVNPFLEAPLVPFPSKNDQDLLVFAMNQFQSEMLTDHGNGSIICLDIVSSRAFDSVKVISISIILNRNAAFLAAFCLHSINDQKEALIRFLTAIKRKIGTLRPSILMSVDEPWLVGPSWKAVMDSMQQPVTVVSPWDIDRSWRTCLTKGSRRLTKQAGLYKALRCLQTEREKAAFKTLFELFTRYSLKRDKAMTSRFEKYENRIQQWAFCCQSANFAAQASAFEVIHATLDGILGDVRAINFDVLLNILLRYVRDMTIRYVDLSSLTETIEMHHDASLLLHPSGIEELNADKWKVMCSSGGQNSVHIVQRLGGLCSGGGPCALRCTACEACVHSFVCSCIVVLCKHVHLVSMLLRKGRSAPSTATDLVIYTEDTGHVSADTLATILSNDDFASHFTFNQLVSDVTTYCQQITSNVANIDSLEQLRRLTEATKVAFEISNGE